MCPISPILTSDLCPLISIFWCPVCIGPCVSSVRERIALGGWKPTRDSVRLRKSGTSIIRPNPGRGFGHEQGAVWGTRSHRGWGRDSPCRGRDDDRPPGVVRYPVKFPEHL